MNEQSNPSTGRARRKKRRRRVLGSFSLLLLLIIVIPLIGVAINCRPFSRGVPAQADTSEQNKATLDTEALYGIAPDDYFRAEDQTYLTYPEWYIVFNADEYAAYLADNNPSGFPYFRAIGQYWQNYYNVCRVTQDQYVWNGPYQMTLVIIGTSFTIENLGRGVYENTIGRLTEIGSAGRPPTQEEVYGQQVAADYGQWVHTVPWFEFPFRDKLVGLWTETDLWGPRPIRKWERKLALTAEYSIKAAYGWLLDVGAEATFGFIDPETKLVSEGVTSDIADSNENVRLIGATADENKSLVAVVRYEAFTQTIPELTAQGVTFDNIAGNDEILITVFAPTTWAYEGKAELLWEHPILGFPESKRLLLNVPVDSLHEVVTDLAAEPVKLEHIFDY